MFEYSITGNAKFKVDNPVINIETLEETSEMARSITKYENGLILDVTASAIVTTIKSNMEFVPNTDFTIYRLK
ncbi:hypothetical protein H7E67_10385 [Clostridium gasigenes]|uniref:hypothetical protein n=1 Tax=Clostridium gasigenes TaxID=94869 RepID=UPI0016259280|nr:hypothetical protein [Clostridium gasigenes]MBB6623834.1 hypothetical protein [Clostridium gasigenes]